MAALTWADITKYVANVVAKETARPDVAHYRALARQCLDIISELTEPVTSAWDNTANGVLTIVGNEIVLPDDCLRLTSVEWLTEALTRMSEAELDYDQPDWRTTTGTPTAYCISGASILLNSLPGTSVGSLVVRGVGVLCDFDPEESAAENPLASLPRTRQWAPAHFILAELPALPDDKLAVARQTKYAALWEHDLAALESTIGQRQRAPFSY